ncbi:15326_t:CDS:2, partial [Racocetra fulgida]
EQEQYIIPNEQDVSNEQYMISSGNDMFLSDVGNSNYTGTGVSTKSTVSSFMKHRQLPENWIQQTSEADNTYYYFNTVTQEMRWTYPGDEFTPGNEQEHDTRSITIPNNIVPKYTGPDIRCVVAYDENLQLVAWGYPALAQEPPKKKKKLAKPQPKPVELFMLHLANIKEEDKPPLPPGLDAKRAITDYLHEMNKLILETLNSRWPDLTTRTLLPGMKIGEITERSGDLCGSSSVDREFLKFLGRKLGFAAMKKLKENYYEQMQYLVQQFCSRAKFSFNGNPNEYTPKELDIERICPALMQYVTGQVREQMEEAEWLIDLDFQTVKDMFDPVVKKIIDLIQRQCASTERRYAAMFLVGGFSESQYLQTQIRRQFATQIPIIAVPKHPIAGAVEYGLNLDIVQTRVLKFCYGVEVSVKWDKSDPPERRTPSG